MTRIQLEEHRGRNVNLIPPPAGTSPQLSQYLTACDSFKALRQTRAPNPFLMNEIFITRTSRPEGAAIRPQVA